ncbi:MAG: DVU0298 family protein [Desulfococcaceae bacterium]
MENKRNSSRELRKKVLVLLCLSDLEKGLDEICTYPAKQLIGPLFSHFFHKDERVRWHAVTAMGAVVDSMAKSGEMESARVVMRRLMWSLNDESGGIGWGSPEAMGEIMARNEKLADEFNRILSSYACEEGNFLEHEVLQRGLLWGIGRLSHVRPGLVRYALPWLLPFLKSADPFHRGLAAWAAGPIADDNARAEIKRLAGDSSEISVFLDGKLRKKTVGELAEDALAN